MSRKARKRLLEEVPKRSMAGCRWFVLTLSLILMIGLSVPADAQLLPLTLPQRIPVTIPVIVQIATTASINLIANLLGATVVDTIPGANTYLLNVPLNLSLNVPLNLPLALPPLNLSFLGIQLAEVNFGVSTPRYAVLGIASVPGT